MCFWKSVGLHNDRRSWFSVIAGRRDDHNIAAFHCPLVLAASNSETASIQLKASSSWRWSRRPVCAATRFRTDANRGSGTTRRNSRSPRPRRRSRIILIRSAVAVTGISLGKSNAVTVTRYSSRSKCICRSATKGNAGGLQDNMGGSGVVWRATTDEDEHYVYAIAL